ncbi:H-NS family nucleoid-associated regulatory protein [Palleronia caenipelagi]|uniref:H-NS histone family protein n=1 Tax=Palleronia caenipelagi TaxID=2489174 RepID=A0A547Q592_9RHOB|nr:H-NS histone family protein [Palleronia caenipelagi]TRD21533.1 H-NS histone family protein [Palleronia caenipelagi]
MDLNLDQMSRDDLKALQRDVEKALATLDDRRRAEARMAAEQAAKEFGFSLEEILAAQKKSGKKNPPKYCNPEDPRQTWSGRGRQPQWIKDALAAGKPLDEFAI